MNSGVSFMTVILLGILLGLVVLLVWKHRRAGIYVGIGLALFLLGGMFLYRFTGVQSAKRYEAEAQLEVIREAETVRRDTFSSVEPIWQVTVENEFEADVYPSLGTAAEALGRKIAPKVAALALQRKPAPKGYIMTYGLPDQAANLPSKISEYGGGEINNIIKEPSIPFDRAEVAEKVKEIVGAGLSTLSDSNVESEIKDMGPARQEFTGSLRAMGNYPRAQLEGMALESMLQELKRIIKAPTFTIERVEGDRKTRDEIRSAEEAVVLLVRITRLTKGSAPWARWSGRQTNGQLEVSVRYGSEEITESIAFVEKPWVTNFSLFLSLEPGEHYIIAQSTKPCTSSSEARYEAMEDAAKQLAYRIIENAGHYRMQFNVGKRSQWVLRDIQALVRTELENSQGERSQATAGSHAVDSEVSYVKVNNRRGKYISDRFVQGFQRPYGAKIWREALLVNMSKENIDELAGRYADTIREKQDSWLKIVSSAIGMLGIVCVVYVFLNSATKGYYTAALRVAAVVLAIVIIGIAVVLA